MLIHPEVPKRIIQESSYTLVADDAVVSPTSFAGRALLQEAVASILRKYLDTFYRVRRERWDTQHMVYGVLDENDPNVAPNRGLVQERPGGAYVVRVRQSERELIAAVQQLQAEVDRLRQQELADPPRIHFDRLLYEPLLLDLPDKARMLPPGLKESEASFVRELKDYWSVEKERALAGKEIFLLRNPSRGGGIGFFEERGFYPDFILWVIDGGTQRIVFVEPHGMLHAKAYIHDEKARLHEALPALAAEMAKRSGRRGVVLDSFIVSATPFDDLRQSYDDGTWDRKRFAERHILFQERSAQYDYMAGLLSETLGEQRPAEQAGGSSDT